MPTTVPRFLQQHQIEKKLESKQYYLQLYTLEAKIVS